MKSIDFVIIGWPKSGTSSLYKWLNDHPDIQGSNPKETFYFMDLDHPLAKRESNYNLHGIQYYQKFFGHSRNNKLFFEATTHYFYQQTAMEYFSKLNPQPIIFVILRNPSERIYSSFHYTMQNLGYINRSLTFNHYVKCLLENKTEELDKFYYSKKSLYIAKKELELSKYVLWLDKWKKLIPPQKLKIVLFEEMKKDPYKLMLNICESLEVDYSYYKDYDFEVKNRTVKIKKQGLHRFARKWGKKMPSSTVKAKLKDIYFKLQIEDKTRFIDGDTSSEGKKLLDTYFKEWNLNLSSKYKLEIKNW